MKEASSIICPYCGKDVPLTDYCVNCGYTLVEGLYDKQKHILFVINKLGGKKVTLAQIYDRIGGSKESLRTLIFRLKSRGFLINVGRGIYSLTDKAESKLEEENEGV